MGITVLGVPRDLKKPRVIGPLGMNLRKERQRLDLRQDDLAERSGVSRSTIIDLETGIRQSANMKTVDALAKALGVASAALLESSEIRRAETAPLVAEFMASPYAQIAKPTPTELEWLLSLPFVVLFDLEPTPETTYHLILGYRARKQTEKP